MADDSTKPQEAIGEDLPASIAPIEAIVAEAEKAQRAPAKCGIMSIKKANDWIRDSRLRPNPHIWCWGLIVQGENTVVYASSNIGKSVFCTQMAAKIAKYRKVLYIDCELSDKQFEMRYTDPITGDTHLFPDNFLRAEIDPELIVGADLEQAILDSIEQAAQEGVEVIFVDNITFLCNDSEKGLTAGEFMMKLIRIKRRHNLTTVVIAHTPKRDGKQPLSQNDLAGSAKLINFFDAGIAIGKSAKDSTLRYLKQTKVRTGTFQYDSEHVAVYRLENTNAFTHFEYQGLDKESNHLREKNAETDLEDINAIVELKKQGKSIREIVEETGFKQTTVFRKIKKAKEMGLLVDETQADAAAAAEPDQTVEPEVEDARLPFKED